MSHDTIAANQLRQDLSGVSSVWLFGYGSLIYKADFPYLERQPAYINGWLRRFWQGSHDHRGTPEKPGRVLTLIENAAAQCTGMAYKVSPDVFAHLDHREKNGYLRFSTTFHLASGELQEGLVYIAAADNAAYLGEASERDIAAHVADSHGPSGPNSEYVLKLAAALRELQVFDEHVFLIEHHLQQLMKHG